MAQLIEIEDYTIVDGVISIAVGVNQETESRQVTINQTAFEIWLQKTDRLEWLNDSGLDTETSGTFDLVEYWDLGWQHINKDLADYIISKNIIDKCEVDLNTLQHSWTAKVRQKNGVIVTIWYTAWQSMKHIVAEVLEVSSNFPKHTINQRWKNSPHANF